MLLLETAESSRGDENGFKYKVFYESSRERNNIFFSVFHMPGTLYFSYISNLTNNLIRGGGGAKLFCYYHKIVWCRKHFISLPFEFSLLPSPAVISFFIKNLTLLNSLLTLIIVKGNVLYSLIFLYFSWNYTFPVLFLKYVCVFFHESLLIYLWILI